MFNMKGRAPCAWEGSGTELTVPGSKTKLASASSCRALAAGIELVGLQYQPHSILYGTNGKVTPSSCSSLSGELILTVQARGGSVSDAVVMLAENACFG